MFFFFSACYVPKCKNECKTPVMDKQNNITQNKYLKRFGPSDVVKFKSKVPYMGKQKDITRNVL